MVSKRALLSVGVSSFAFSRVDASSVVSDETFGGGTTGLSKKQVNELARILLGDSADFDQTDVNQGSLLVQDKDVLKQLQQMIAVTTQVLEQQDEERKVLEGMSAKTFSSVSSGSVAGTPKTMDSGAGSGDYFGSHTLRRQRSKRGDLTPQGKEQSTQGKEQSIQPKEQSTQSSRHLTRTFSSRRRPGDMSSDEEETGIDDGGNTTSGRQVGRTSTVVAKLSLTQSKRGANSRRKPLSLEVVVDSDEGEGEPAEGQDESTGGNKSVGAPTDLSPKVTRQETDIEPAELVSNPTQLTTDPNELVAGPVAAAGNQQVQSGVLAENTNVEGEHGSVPPASNVDEAQVSACLNELLAVLIQTQRLPDVSIGEPVTVTRKWNGFKGVKQTRKVADKDETDEKQSDYSDRILPDGDDEEEGDDLEHDQEEDIEEVEDEVEVQKRAVMGGLRKKYAPEVLEQAFKNLLIMQEAFISTNLALTQTESQKARSAEIELARGKPVVKYAQSNSYDLNMTADEIYEALKDEYVLIALGNNAWRLRARAALLKWNGTGQMPELPGDNIAPDVMMRELGGLVRYNPDIGDQGAVTFYLATQVVDNKKGTLDRLLTTVLQAKQTDVKSRQPGVLVKPGRVDNVLVRSLKLWAAVDEIKTDLLKTSAAGVKFNPRFWMSGQKLSNACNELALESKANTSAYNQEFLAYIQRNK